MEPLAPADVTPAVRAAVELTIARLGSHRLVVSADWRPFAAACGLDASPADADERVPPVVVGSAAHVLAALPDAHEIGRIGFITPASVGPAGLVARVLARGETIVVDPTRQLWSANWSPLAIERIDVNVGRSVVELVIGDARPRPESLVGRSAFDNSN